MIVFFSLPVKVFLDEGAVPEGCKEVFIRLSPALSGMSLVFLSFRPRYGRPGFFSPSSLQAVYFQEVGVYPISI